MNCVPVHPGILAVLHRDVPWLHRHSENGAVLVGHFQLVLMNKPNKAEPAVFLYCRSRFSRLHYRPSICPCRIRVENALKTRNTH